MAGLPDPLPDHDGEMVLSVLDKAARIIKAAIDPVDFAKTSDIDAFKIIKDAITHWLHEQHDRHRFIHPDWITVERGDTPCSACVKVHPAALEGMTAAQIRLLGFDVNEDVPDDCVLEDGRFDYIEITFRLPPSGHDDARA